MCSLGLLVSWSEDRLMVVTQVFAADWQIGHIRSVGAVLGEIAQLLFLSDWKTACDGFNYVDGRLLVMCYVLIECFSGFVCACPCAICSLNMLFAAMSCSNVDNSP